MKGWISVKTKLPPENETVWCYSKKRKTVFLGCHVYLPNEGWFWAQSNGIIYVEKGKIVTEADIDDLDVTHWHSVPEIVISKGDTHKDNDVPKLREQIMNSLSAINEVAVYHMEDKDSRNRICRELRKIHKRVDNLTRIK